MRQSLTRTLAALAFVSAAAVGTAAPAMAQVYLEGLGVDIGVGPRWHDHYRGGPYYHHHHFWRYDHHDWD